MSAAVILSWLVSIAVMVGWPIALAIWFKRRYRLGWRAFFYGALIFALFQLVTRIPLTQLISARLAPALKASPRLNALYLIGLGFSAGLFESVGRWAGYRWLFRQRLPYDWQHGVAYGIGHGGIESIVLTGLVSISNLISAIHTTNASVEILQATYKGDLLASVLAARKSYLAMSWYEPLYGGLERLLTLPFHIALSLVVLLVFTRGHSRWLWAAVGLHGLVDTLAVMLTHVLGWPVWGIELVMAGWTAGSLWLILKLRGEGQGDSPKVAL
jgi:uncharacterized membrane protein YhfC